MKVLVTGLLSTQGLLVGQELVRAGHEVLGMDQRAGVAPPQGVRLFHTDLLKRDAEDVFRKERPEAVIHMATITQTSQSRTNEQFRANLKGTQAVFDFCHAYGVRVALFVGRHTYYGAAPDSPLYHTEDEPPLGIESFPELADLVAADLYAGSALWRHPHIDTSVLRLCYTLGPSGHGTLASFLEGPRVPTILGFDPLFQLMHEADAARAIVAALERRLRGVFNVAGPRPLPLSVIIKHAGRSSVPLPRRLFPVVLGRLGLPDLPSGALNHVKYPVIIDDRTFRKATDFRHEFDEYATVDAFRASQSPPGN